MNDERVYIGPNSRFTGLYRPIFTKGRVYIGPFPEVTSKAQIPTGLYRPKNGSISAQKNGTRVYIGPKQRHTGLYRPMFVFLRVYIDLLPHHYVADYALITAPGEPA